MAEPGNHRVFFALWPTNAVLQALDDLAGRLHQRCGGRRMRRDTLHITLAFIGSASNNQLTILKQIAGSLVAEPFDLKLDRLGYWARTRILWAGCSQAPHDAIRLFGMLSGELASAGIALENRPFVPHVTLLRDVVDAKTEAIGDSIDWRVDQFQLIESRPCSGGYQYLQLDQWVLASDESVSKKKRKVC